MGVTLSRRETRRRRRPAATLELRDSVHVAGGCWNARGLGAMPVDLGLQAPGGDDVRLDLTGVQALDTVGAWLVHQARERLAAAGATLHIDTASDEHRDLIKLVADQAITLDDIAPPPEPGFFEDIGRDTLVTLATYRAFLAFIGRLTSSSLRILLTPAQMRWRTVVRDIEEAGFDALPIVGLLNFLLGIVIAYQGGVLMRQYGAGVFVADLVGLSMVRELAPLITAIIVAGRTGSAYTAQIATMKVTEEVDALRTMGVAPIEALALPKFLALIVALPLLTMFGDIMGVLGGMIMANSMLDISFPVFFQRLAQSVSVESFLIGIGKAPVFAIMITAVGCFQGFEAGHGADEVGRRTTASVVHSIFLVIVVDAVFSIVFSKVGI